MQNSAQFDRARLLIRDNKAARAFVERAAHRLEAKGVVKADLWAMRYRYVHDADSPSGFGPMRFLSHPWTREMLTCDAEECVGMKAAQMGYTESVGLTRALYTIDQLKRDVLYVLPNKNPAASEFSTGRFKPAIETSPYLTSLFSNTNNVGQKMAGHLSLYIRGARSRTDLKSLPVGLIVMDEEDEFGPEAVVLVRERLSGHDEGKRQLWHISTPGVPKKGIASVFEISDQSFFYFKCPHCSRLINLEYPRNLKITAEDIHDPELENSYIFCHECGATLDHYAKRDFLSTGRFVPTYPSRRIKGFHVSQLYSTTIHPRIIAEYVLLARSDPYFEQEFYNSKLGLPHVVASINITDDDYLSAIRPYPQRDPALMAKATGRGWPITMGIDVGKACHYEIAAWELTNHAGQSQAPSTDINAIAFKHVIAAGTVADFHELDNLTYTFRPMSVVIDHLPETRKALEYARRYPGIVKLCHFGNKVGGRDITDHGEMVTVNRTTWLDVSLNRYKTGMIELPSNVPSEHRMHTTALVRVPTSNKETGDVTYSYVSNSADHYAFAAAYSEIALALIPKGGAATSLTSRTR